MITNFISVVSAGFKVLYIACLWAGWLNTTILLGILRGTVWVFTSTALGICVLCEDFLLFLEDVVETVECCIGSLVEGIVAAVEGIWDLGSLLVKVLTTIPTSLLNSMMSCELGTFSVNFIILVKDAVLLLGMLFWEAFAWIFAALTYLNEAPYIVVLLLARAADRLLTNLLFTAETYGFRSTCGLVMAYGVYILAKNAGILPEQTLTTLIYLGLKRCLSEAYRAIRITLVRLSGLLYVLKLAALSTVAFIRSQTQAVMAACKELYRYFICYTPTKAALQIKLDKEKASSQCVVCMDERRNIMILRCRHLSMCKACAMTVAVNTGACPVCRTTIDDMIIVFT